MPLVLTDADVLALEAGRELDSLVARQVMGLRPGLRLPCYSTDLADAWLVVEHYRADPAYDWVVNFVVFTCQEVATGAREYVVDFNGGNCPGRATAPTLPLAVCRAALGLELWRQRRADA